MLKKNQVLLVSVQNELGVRFSYKIYLVQTCYSVWVPFTRFDLSYASARFGNV